VAFDSVPHPPLPFRGEGHPLKSKTSEVSDISGGEIEEAPSFEQGIDTDFIIGLGKVKEKIILLLDIEKVLSSGELEIVEQLAKE